MASNARKHVIPAGTETNVTRETIFETFGNSMHDLIPVANTTERAQAVLDLVAAGVGPSSTNPVVVVRGDAPGLHRIEYSYDGTVFLPASGVLQFASLAAATSWATANPGLLITGDRCRINGADYEWAGAWYPVGMRAVLSAASSTSVASGVDVKIDFDDPGDLPPGLTWNESTKEITVGRALRLKITARGRWQNNSTGFRALIIRKNGTLLPGQASGPAGSGVETGQVADSVESFVAGDKITVTGTQNSGATLSFVGAQLSIERF